MGESVLHYTINFWLKKNKCRLKPWFGAMQKAICIDNHPDIDEVCCLFVMFFIIEMQHLLLRCQFFTLNSPICQKSGLGTSID